MPKISDLKLLLYRVNARLTEHPVFTRGTGVPVDDPAHDRENAELGRLSLQLSLIARELNSKSNLLSIREKTTRSMSQSDRYRATASIRDQQAEISEVLALAKELQARLEGMIRKSCSIGDGELAQGIGDFIEKMYHQCHTHGETQNMPDGLAYLPAGKEDFGGSVEGVTIAVFVALRVLLHLRKRGVDK
jgi:hypothetical protein